MKTPLLLFCTLFVLEHFVTADKNEFTKSPIFKDLYQKKGKERLMNGPKLVNRRLLKLKYGEPRTKKHIVGDGYTVFPTHNKKQVVDVPSSPYFSGDPHNDEPKLRVKKVLPDFWNSHDRKKRSPDTAAEKAHPAAAVKKENKTAPVATAKKEDKKANPATKVGTTNAKAEVKPARKSNKPVAKAPAKVAKRKSNKKSRKPAGKGKVKNHRRRGHTKKSKKAHVKSSKKLKAKRQGGNHNKKAKKDVETRRLIAGRDGMIENYPYVVSIQKDGEHWCAGALLNQRLVITTANCVWKSSRMSRMKIRAGSRHLEHGGQLVAIAEVLKHPGWSIRKNPDHDVALLLTDGFVKFSHSCHAVDLPNRVMMPIFDDAWIASWGAERRDGVYVRQGLTLQVYHSRLMNRDKCNNVTMRFGVMVTENFICLEQIGRRSPCTRDTGAPAVSDGVLWGLASWGIRKMCGTERFPAMFSYIASQSNMDFIINGTRYLMSEERLSPFPDRYNFPRQNRNPSNT